LKGTITKSQFAWNINAQKQRPKKSHSPAKESVSTHRKTELEENKKTKESCLTWIYLLAKHEKDVIWCGLNNFNPIKISKFLLSNLQNWKV